MEDSLLAMRYTSNSCSGINFLVVSISKNKLVLLGLFLPACGDYFYCISIVFLFLPDNFRQTLGQIYRFVYIINN